MKEKNSLMKILPVEKVLIKDFGIIKKADIKFSSGLNLITGESATGKTTVLNYLIKRFGPASISWGNKIIFNINNEINKNCILIDDSLSRLNKEQLIKILKNLETCNQQVIATIDQLDFIKIKAKIINTKEFELNLRDNNI